MLRIGDKVAVVDDQLEGRVVSVNAERIRIETNDGFQMEFAPAELVKIGPDELFFSPRHSIAEVIREKESDKKPKPKRIRPKERKVPPMEVDLHIESLLRSHAHMSSHEKLTYQLDTARRQLEFAMSKRIPKLVFIHGVGEGRLKIELDYLLSRYDNLNYYDADYMRYGQGATEVHFFQNP